MAELTIKLSDSDVKRIAHEVAALIRTDIGALSADMARQAQDDDDFITVAEACELLKIGKTTLYEWQRAGAVPAAKRIGPHMVRYRRGDIRRLAVERES